MAVKPEVIAPVYGSPVEIGTYRTGAIALSIASKQGEENDATGKNEGKDGMLIGMGKITSPGV